eukprot:CAMPEP_0185419666 /NCGR_PEP_ID=MMETSP1365-20130426/9706_1 /TAXON_ID=38817 /ORGANISM="Gephyrocapsa oceanica, Strain RCC1303" /LENGTH=84 /DNA_ID=CAMNT_0028023227 /DNA_START=85 /DNA_END=337 /DNA_ORIENTATION=-
MARPSAAAVGEPVRAESAPGKLVLGAQPRDRRVAQSQQRSPANNSTRRAVLEAGSAHPSAPAGAYGAQACEERPQKARPRRPAP